MDKLQRVVPAQSAVAVSPEPVLRLFLQYMGGKQPDIFAASDTWLYLYLIFMLRTENRYLPAGSTDIPTGLVGISLDCVAKLPLASIAHTGASLLAAASLAHDRRCRGLVPVWPWALRRLTGFEGPGEPVFDAAILSVATLQG